MLEMHMSIGWGHLSDSVGFLSFQKAKMAVFAYILPSKPNFSDFPPKFTKKSHCKA